MRTKGGSGMLQWTLEGLTGHRPSSAAQASLFILRAASVHLLDLSDEGVDEVLDLRGLG